MHGIILAAGRGVRMGALTAQCPKPMLRVNGKPLIAHMIDALPQEVDKLVIVTAYLAEAIEEGLGSEYDGREISYVRQSGDKGTAAALWQCRDRIPDDERFLLMYADDLHDADAIKELLVYGRAMLVHEVTDPSRFGIVTTSTTGVITDIVEKPESSDSRLAAIGVYLLGPEIFNYWPAKDEKSGEYILTDSIARAIKDMPMYAVESRFWVPVGYPEDLETAAVRMAYRRPGRSILTRAA